MTVYLDSSALVKLYIPDNETAALAAYVRTLEEPLPFSHLHELEVKNALRLKVFRREASSRPANSSIRAVSNDLASGVLARPEVDWPDVFRQAEDLSKRFSARFGSRSLDLLHIAIALLIPCRNFLTFDQRQAAVARKAGLHMILLKPSARRITSK